MKYTLILLIIATLLLANPRFRKDSGVFYFEFFFLGKQLKIRLWRLENKTPPQSL